MTTRPPRMNGRPAGCGGGKIVRKSIANDISVRLVRGVVYEWFIFREQHTLGRTGSGWHAVQGTFHTWAVFGRCRGAFVPGPPGRFTGIQCPLARADRPRPSRAMRWPRWMSAYSVQFGANSKYGIRSGHTSLGCLTMLRSLLSSLPPAWSARLLPDHQPQLEVETIVALPITVTNLVAELTLFLIVLSPYLDLMDRA